MGPVATEVLRTYRLVLRPYVPDDEQAVIDLFSDPVVNRHVGDGPLSRDDAKALFWRIFPLYEEARFCVWAVEEAATGAYIGSAELKPMVANDREGDWEIVYVFSESAWGKGYATEVGAALVAHGAQVLGLRRVAATVDYDNHASIRVLGKIGMAFVREIRDDKGPYAMYATQAG